MTFYSARASEKLGQKARAKKLFHGLLAYAQTLQKARAKIDYFATSLPTMLLFDDDLQFRQETSAMFLQAQAYLGLGRRAAAKKSLQDVLRRDPNHALAADLMKDFRWNIFATGVLMTNFTDATFSSGLAGLGCGGWYGA